MLQTLCEKKMDINIKMERCCSILKAMSDVPVLAGGGMSLDQGEGETHHYTRLNILATITFLLKHVPPR